MSKAKNEKEYLYKDLPEMSGVYFMKDASGNLLYIGKAGNLKRRVSSYFLRPHDSRIERLVAKIKKIDFETTDTALEALIREAELIKKYEPPFNIKEKDDKSFLYVEITKEAFPRVLLVRGKQKQGEKLFGPFTSASSIREALRIIRKIFPTSVHDPEMLGKFKRPCFDYEIGLCPGTCIGAISQKEYKKTIAHIKLIFQGKKQKLLINLGKEMREASRKLEFERATTLRKKIFALQHIQDIALIKDTEEEAHSRGGSGVRVEGYDISNIGGELAVGVMVVFQDGAPDKNSYRKFKIRTISTSDDVGMMKEIIRRRFHNNWPFPDMLLIDGGKGQVNGAEAVLREFGLKIPVVGIAKGPERKRNDFIGKIPSSVTEKILILVRDEAHRFAIQYHKKVRAEEFLP